MKKIIFVFLSALSLSLMASPVQNELSFAPSVNDCRNAADWNTFNGSEFKGATVSHRSSGDGILLNYDFSAGGAYVTLQTKKFIFPNAKTYLYTIQPNDDVELSYRLLDASGRWFQSPKTILKKNMTTEFNMPVRNQWHSAWGGKSSPQPQLPLRDAVLMVNKKKGLPQTGSLILKNVHAELMNLKGENGIQAEPFSASITGWKVAGQWFAQSNGTLLQLTATPAANAVPTTLEIIMPSSGRDEIKRYILDPAKGTRSFIYVPKFLNGLNPRNIYTFKIVLNRDGSDSRTVTSRIYGELSSGINLGAPKNSREIKSSKFGTCVHFKYAPKPTGAFRGWYDYKRILDEISACGFKYIRDGVGCEKDANGTYLRVTEHGKNVLKEAKKRGIEMILEFELRSGETIEQHLQKVDVLVRDTKDYVRIYEAGNEPHNFGNWRKKFKGSWNGYEKDGSISEWVREYVKYTNAIADHLKKIYPDSTVIGLGACAPTNFHALNLNVTKNLDGVTEHPYTFSMPPEIVPFGWGLTKRDGIQVGDKEHTFAGLVASYHEQFKKTGQPRQLWVTEFGFTNFWFNGKVESRLYAGFSEQAQANYLVRRFIESLALPIEVTCQYDFIDDYNSDASSEEANFGLLRSDFSRKPAFYAVQRMNSLFAGAGPDSAVTIKVTDAPLHRSAKRTELIRNWDDASMKAANGVRSYGFKNPDAPKERLLAVWSMLPYSEEFNNRVVSLELAGWNEFAEPPIGINLMTGESFDLKAEFKDGKTTVKHLSLKAPVLIKFFKK